MVRGTSRTGVSAIHLKALAFFMLASCAVAQDTTQVPIQPASDGPAIWTLSDEDTKIHIFGYAQVLKPGTDWKSDTFRSRFASSDVLLLETDGSNPAAQQSAQATIASIGLYQDEKTLSSVLNEAQAAEIDSFTTSLGAPLPALDALKPWLASVQIGVLNLNQSGYDLTSAPSLVLAQDAQATGKTIRSLEGPTDLMERIAELPESEHIGMLLHTIEFLRDRPDQTDQLNLAWLAGNQDEIASIMHGKGAWASSTLYELMLVSRNNEWADEISRIMTEETGEIFMAVGLGHLAGKDNLVSMLDTRGYSAIRQ